MIKDQLNKGVIEIVDDNSLQGKLKHIPHHAVPTPTKNTKKLRIVYDASTRTMKSNVSSNECLQHDPVILKDLCILLIRLQSHKVVLVPNLEKAFLQVSLQEKDRDVTRFL